MAIGPTLKEARINKQLSESQVAELTRMKIQLVQDLENDDFHRIAATIYGKGFIKLYAQCVGLDPKPLIADYVQSVEGDNPSLITHGVDNPLSKPMLDTQKPSVPQPEPEKLEQTEVEVEPEPDPDDLFVYTKNKNTIIDDSLKEEPTTDLDQDNNISIITKTKDNISSTATTIRKQSENLANRIADIQWGDAPLKIIGIVIGTAIILLILTITIKSCSRNHPQPTTDQSAKHLQTPAPPPEPYFD